MRKQSQAGLPATPSQGSGLRGGRGQTLIEILLAVTVSIIVLSAIVVGIVNSLNNTQYTKNQNLANSYAQEGISVVKAIKDSSWTDLFSYTTNKTYCIDQNSVVLRDPAVNCVSNVGIFSREVKFQHDSLTCEGDPSCVTGCNSEATITVSWADSKCPVGNIRCHDVELITCLSNIDKKSIN